MTVTSEHVLQEAMTSVVADLERALELLLADPEHTLTKALLATDLHEVIVTIHEVTEMGSTTAQALPGGSAHALVARACATVDALPAAQRPLWLLPLRAEMAGILKDVQG